MIQEQIRLILALVLAVDPAAKQTADCIRYALRSCFSSGLRM
jgi:hypothetical protein